MHCNPLLSLFSPAKIGSALIFEMVNSENIPAAAFPGQRYLQISQRAGEGAAQEGGGQGLIVETPGERDGFRSKEEREVRQEEIDPVPPRHP
jgi:hypothetical protein